MTTELAMAALVAVIGIVHVMLQAAEFRRVHGVKYANTAKDTPSERPDSVMLGRLTRAQANLMETAPFFIAFALIIAFASISSELTRGAAIVFVGARVLYIPLYAFGVPWLRGLVWIVSFAALLVMAYAVLSAINWASVFTI